jgi:hypothetical protein
MILVAGFVWIGFTVFLVKALRSEKKRKATRFDQADGPSKTVM